MLTEYLPQFTTAGRTCPGPASFVSERLRTPSSENMACSLAGEMLIRRMPDDNAESVRSNAPGAALGPVVTAGSLPATSTRADRTPAHFSTARRLIVIGLCFLAAEPGK